MGTKKKQEPETEPKIVELFSDDETDIKNVTTREETQQRGPNQDQMNNYQEKNDTNEEVSPREGRPANISRTVHDKFTMEEKLDARSRSRQPLSPRLAETLQNDPLYAYEVHDNRKVIHPMNHEIVDGWNKELHIEEDTLRQQGGLSSIGGKIEWRRAAEKKKRMLEQNEKQQAAEQDHEIIIEEETTDQMSLNNKDEKESVADEDGNREQNFI